VPASFAIGLAAIIGIAFLQRMSPRLIVCLFILFWVAVTHLVILLIRDLGIGVDTGSAIAAYFVALVCGVGANFVQIRELMELRKGSPELDGKDSEI